VCMQARSGPCVDACVRVWMRHVRSCASACGVGARAWCADADPPNTARASSGVGARLLASAAGRRFSRAISFFAAHREQTIRRSDGCVETTATPIRRRSYYCASERTAAIRPPRCIAFGRLHCFGSGWRVMTIGYPTRCPDESTAAVRGWDLLRVTTAPTSAMGAAFNHSTSRRRTGEDEVGVVVVRGGGLDGLVLRDREVLDDVPAESNGTAAFPQLTVQSSVSAHSLQQCAHSACAAMHDRDARVCPRAWRGVVVPCAWRAHAAAG
jgi:hypothetical protein